MNLNSADFSTLTDFKLMHHDEEVKDFLYHVSGTLILTGDQDIAPDTVYKPLSIVLNSSEGRWKTFKITKKTNLLDCNLVTKDNFLYFDTRELKNDDYIIFEAFYNANKSGFSLAHRILNVKNRITTISEKERNNYYGRIGSAIVIILVVIAAFFFLKHLANSPTTYNPNDYNYTVTKEIDQPTEKDSILKNKYNYNELYFIKGKSLKNDSIFRVNSKLNKMKNISSATKSLDHLSNVDELSIYFKKDSILENLLLANHKIKKENKYKINDSISVSFLTHKESYNRSDPINYFKYIVILALSYSLYNIIKYSYYLYLLKKYERIAKST